MKQITIHIILCILFFSISELKAQDIHFSQFFASPLNTNPANTGNFEGTHRFVLNNKNQWQSFADAYRTFAGSFDMNFENIFTNNSLAGLGLQINNDIAGDGKLGTTQIYLNSAYYLPMVKQHKIYAGLGLNIGYVFHSIDFEKLTFGDQYNGQYFDPVKISEELWNSSKINYFDMGLGINFIYKNNPDFIPQVGFSASHITMPGKSFTKNSDRYLPIKWTASGSFNFKIKEDFWMEPLFLIMLQQKYKEYNFGALFKFDYNFTGLQSIYFGGMLRTRDAGIAYLGIKYNNIRMTINYDINISKLTQISRGKGGIELSLIYIFTKPKIFDSPYYRKCPDFI